MPHTPEFILETNPELSIVEELTIVQIKGHSQLSRLYQYEIVFTVPATLALEKTDIDDLLKSTWKITCIWDPEPILELTGVVREVQIDSPGFDFLPANDNRPISYRAILVPRFQHAAQTFRSRTYVDREFKMIIESILKETGMESGGSQFDIDVKSTLRDYSYVVQFQETDFHFVNRLFEYEGFFYFFEQTEQGEKLIITDRNDRCPLYLDGEAIPFRPVENIVQATFGSIQSLHWRKQVLPKELYLRDFNVHDPSDPLHGYASVDTQTGVGLHAYFGDFIRIENESKVAKIRSEELMARQEIYWGECTVVDLCPGHRFKTGLDIPTPELQDREFLVTDTMLALTPDGVSNRFIAIPAEVPFRPPRNTPQPRIHGIIPAKVAGSSHSTMAPMNEKGRYRVHFPFDSGDDGSKPIRMAQVLAGSSFGIQFPLQIGTEVLVAHVQGDPDRPIIIAAAPNPELGSPLADVSASKSLILTQSDIRVEFEDDA